MTLSLRLVYETYQKIKEIALKEERSINGMINYILKKFVEEYEKKDCN